MRKTCPPSEYLKIDNNIKSLANEILSNEEIFEAETISQSLEKKSSRLKAIRFLQKKVGDRPKRPIYYANFELNYLPYRTRDAVRYAGDYIDQLVKCLAIEIWGNPSYGQKSLGVNLRHLHNKIPELLYSGLERYNNWIYVPAKHEFKIKEGRKHLFTSKEVVYIYYITLKLKEKIVEISKEAKNYSEDFYP